MEILSGRHDRGRFVCGVELLDVYLRRIAAQDARRSIATVFVALEKETGSVGGYYTLSMSGVAMDDLPQELARRMPHYPMMPAVRLGRLAVRSDVQGLGLGTHLLMDAFARSLRSGIAWAVFLVDALDVRARDFYHRFGFRSFLDDDRHLFVTRRTIEPLFP